MAITSGKYTIGVAMDYASHVLWEADFGVPDGELEGELNTSYTTTATCNFNVASSYPIRMTSADPHLGDQTAGYVVTMGANAIPFQFGAAASYYEMQGFRLTAGIWNNYMISFSGAYTSRIHDMFLDGKNAAYPIRYRSTPTSRFYNCVIWNANAGQVTLYHIAATAGDRVENVTVYDGGYNYYLTNNTVTYENCASLAEGVAGWSLATNATGNGVLSTDATIPSSGTPQYTSATIANEVQSTDDTDGDLFMLPKTGASGDMTAGGTTTHTWSSVDMKGNEWDPSTPSIGAFQFPLYVPSGGGSPIGAIYRHLRNRRIQHSDKK